MRQAYLLLVFLSYENGNEIPFYLIAKLGDSCHSVKTNIEGPKNPNQLVDIGTPLYFALEQVRQDDDRHNV